MKDQLKQVFLRSWSPAEKGLLLADVLLSGVLLGWLTSPFRSVKPGNGSKFFVDADPSADEDGEDQDVDNCTDENADGSTIEIETEKR